MLVIHIFRSLPHAVHLYFGKSPKDSNNQTLGSSAAPAGPKRVCVMPSTASVKQVPWNARSEDARSLALVSCNACRRAVSMVQDSGLSLHLSSARPRAFAYLGLWSWTYWEKDEIYVSCWDVLHSLEDNILLWFLYCSGSHVISFLPFSE